MRCAAALSGQPEARLRRLSCALCRSGHGGPIAALGVLLIVGAAGAAVPDTSCRIIANHSGTVTHQVESGVHHYYLDSGDLYYCYWLNVYTPVTLVEAGYLGFDLAAIPVTALIQAATIFFCQYYDTFSTPLVTPVVFDYQPWTPESVFAAVLRGQAVGAQVICQPSWNQAAFDSSGLRALKAALPQDSIFFALKPAGGISEGVAHGCTAPESLRPCLLVDYLPSGIEESPRPRASSPKPAPTIVRGALFLGGDCPRTGTVPKAVLLDIGGRRVLTLLQGPNDVSRLAPGVYFVHSTVDNRQSEMTKVVIAQ